MSVCNCKVGIHFDSFQVGPETAARFMSGGCLLNSQPSAASPADNPGADKMVLRSSRLARGLHLSAAHYRQR